jgi:putative endopeptidase
MTMRFARLLLVVLSSASMLAQQQVSVQVADIDRNADPCVDFFQYSNGAWRAANPIPASMTRWSRRWAAGEAAKDRLKEILEEVSRRSDWQRGSVEQLIGDYYVACMDEARVDKLGLAPAKPMLAQIDGIKSAADLQAAIRSLQELGVSVPFGFGSRPDNHDPSQTIGDVAAAGLGLPDRDYYLKPDQRFVEIRQKYHDHVARMLVLAGATPDAAKTAAESVFQFEKKLAEASLDNVALRDPAATDHKTSFADLKKLAPAFDWDAFFNHAHISRADLNVSEPKFLQEVDRQIRETPLPEWKSYLKWQLLNAGANALSAPFVNENFAFTSALTGAKELKPRWKRCAEEEDQLLGEALGRKYVEKYFPPAAKARMQELVKNELTAMHDIIEGLDWMTPETKKRALDKLARFTVKVGYPDKWKDYSSIPISRDSYWNNGLAALRWNVADDRALIGKPTDRTRWGMTPPTSDAYNNFLLNEIVFPAGILQPPAFDVNAVDAVNYGAIGVVIGHEISHGFDDQGAKFDALGRLDNWWTQDDLKRFQQRTACVERQFDGYFIEPGIHHNGKLVLGESIGDLAGAKVAYLAFKKAQQTHPAATIGGFTPDQQFFIAWGQFRGDETRPEQQRRMIQGDPHPVAKYRVIGPLSNIPAFAEAFKCKPGSPMVRPAAERCEVW